MSILEYGSVVWDSVTYCGMIQIERVQRNSLNFAAHKLTILITHPMIILQLCIGLA